MTAPVVVKPSAPSWLATARRFDGLKEIPGPKHNPTIMQWAATGPAWIKAAYTGDEIPWCGLFCAGCFREALPGLKLPANPLSAAAWGAPWGLQLLTPSLGAVLVFKRPGGGHVGFYEGEDATHYHVRGGNQGNAVSVVRIERNRLVGIRWPKGQPLPASGRVFLLPKGSTSKNEA